MYEMPIRSVMRRRGLAKAPPEATVRKAAKLMEQRNTGAVLVIDGDRLVGIFTERDVVFRVTARDLDARTTRLGDVMTPNPRIIGPAQTFGYALALMHQHRIRHLPVVEDGKVVGIVSARSALDPDLEQFRAETRRREGLATGG